MNPGGIHTLVIIPVGRSLDGVAYAASCTARARDHRHPHRQRNTAIKKALISTNTKTFRKHLYERAKARMLAGNDSTIRQQRRTHWATLPAHQIFVEKLLHCAHTNGRLRMTLKKSPNLICQAIAKRKACHFIETLIYTPSSESSDSGRPLPAQAMMPPWRLYTSLTPCCARKAQACAERAPL